MKIFTKYHTISNPTYSTRMLITHPVGDGPFPAVICYSDIFQLSETMIQVCKRLASYGFAVFAPEIFARRLEAGTVLSFDDQGRERGLAAAASLTTEEFDSDLNRIVEELPLFSFVRPEKIAAVGFCMGGHLAFRAALNPRIQASTCFYPTGLHNGKLGKDLADTPQKLSHMQKPVLIFFGTQDPHIPAEARMQIHNALSQAPVPAKIFEYEAEHAFMRDDGPRYDPEIGDRAWGEMIAFFNTHFR